MLQSTLSKIYLKKKNKLKTKISISVCTSALRSILTTTIKKRKQFLTYDH